ncbi:hypothetical protein [Kineococcus gypseus]
MLPIDSSIQQLFDEATSPVELHELITTAVEADSDVKNLLEGR